MKELVQWLNFGSKKGTFYLFLIRTNIDSHQRPQCLEAK